MTAGFLLDTNHLSQAVTPGSIVRKRLAQLCAAGAKVGTCVPVLCEIEAGLQQVSRPDVYRVNLDRLLHQVRLWPLSPSTSRLYGTIHHDLKRRGRVLSQVDIMLASIALDMNLTLATTDRDFEALPQVSTENWLIP